MIGLDPVAEPDPPDPLPGSDSVVVAVVPAHDPGSELLDLVAGLLSPVGPVGPVRPVSPLSPVSPSPVRPVGPTRVVSAVVVVDDGSTEPRAREVLTACAQAGARISRHPGNRGVAAALNTGVTVALELQPDAAAVLTLDQDSWVGAGYVGSLLTAWRQARAVGLKVGLVAPERVTGLPTQRSAYRAGVALGRDPIQSGLLVPVTTLGTVGRFDEALFIDGVDSDYALRCLDAGLLVVVARGAELGHRLGLVHEVRVAGRRFELSRPAPFRHYYLARNRTRLIRRHGRRHPAWAVGQAAGLARHLVLTLALAPDRGVRARETLSGIRDAARGVSGPRPGTSRG